MKKFKVKTTDFKSKQNLRFKDETVFNDDIVYHKAADKHYIQFAMSAPTYNEIYEETKNASFLQQSMYGTFLNQDLRTYCPKNGSSNTRHPKTNTTCTTKKM